MANTIRECQAAAMDQSKETTGSLAMVASDPPASTVSRTPHPFLHHGPPSCTRWARLLISTDTAAADSRSTEARGPMVLTFPMSVYLTGEETRQCSSSRTIYSTHITIRKVF